MATTKIGTTDGRGSTRIKKRVARFLKRMAGRETTRTDLLLKNNESIQSRRAASLFSPGGTTDNSIIAQGVSPGTANHSQPKPRRGDRSTGTKDKSSRYSSAPKNLRKKTKNRELVIRSHGDIQNNKYVFTIYCHIFSWRRNDRL